jgi:hypothetical protein
MSRCNVCFLYRANMPTALGDVCFWKVKRTFSLFEFSEGLTSRGRSIDEEEGRMS